MIAYQTLEEMMRDYQIPDMRSLINLTDNELEQLITIVKLHDGKEKLSDLVKNAKDEDEKVKIVVDQMAQKLCRCFNKTQRPATQDQLTQSQRIAICISSIFHSKGITISRFDCNGPIPMLLPKKGEKAVIRRFVK
jgi:hypothetical protein